MSPHLDTSSPTGSYTTSHFSTTRNGAVQVPSYSSYQANFETSSIESGDVGLHRALLPGIYVPTVAFFDLDTEDLDLETTAKHAVRLAQAGIQGITTQGSNGEAVHISHRERNLGDYALVLPPSYYVGLHTKHTVMSFFRDVASASPIPILIYNYPPAAGGIDLNSDSIIELSKHSNIAGCKLTCGNTGKLNRVAAGTRAATPSEPGSGFMCMGGSVDFTLQTLIGGGSGIIGGFANIAPKACVKLVELFEAGNLKEARKLQAVIARGDWAAIQGGVVGTKSALQSHFGYGGYARKPLPRPGKEETKKWRDAFDEVVKLERSL
jgi:dihydrodipicolinate synthase/N-acetylneuraminate lyase